MFRGLPPRIFGAHQSSNVAEIVLVALLLEIYHAGRLILRFAKRCNLANIPHIIAFPFMIDKTILSLH
jgi:hypothetical protein